MGERERGGGRGAWKGHGAEREEGTRERGRDGWAGVLAGGLLGPVEKKFLHVNHGLPARPSLLQVDGRALQKAGGEIGPLK